jgi:hypothetical protein
MGQGAQKRFPPNPKALASDISRVVDNREAADQLVILAVQRLGVDVDRRDSNPQEGIRTVIFF